MMKAGIRVGIDFDNTVVSYDDVFYSTAADWLKIENGIGRQKQTIRDYIRLLPDGEVTWQRLQGFVYGKGIGGATMFAGVDRFLRRCRAAGHTVLIVSHKTEFGHHDPDRVNLREAALGWMKTKGFFREDGYAIPIDNVFFESTRAEKLARIAALDCDYFIDDLEEVLSDPGFPNGVTRILFARCHQGRAPAPFQVCPTWQHIERQVFRA